eukprot:GILK01005564.1.p1 GENE.GILK01005564.1~~GILK01005564.1.p1  ORF type:complete len:296 (-),score=65.88 GILK01005564.1:258-1145(-)
MSRDVLAFKVTVVGAVHTGKTCIVNQYVNNRFEPLYKDTEQVCVFKKVEFIGDEDDREVVLLEIEDTFGSNLGDKDLPAVLDLTRPAKKPPPKADKKQPKKGPQPKVNPLYEERGRMGFMVVFDVTSAETFQEAQSLMELIEANVSEMKKKKKNIQPILALLGNKTDREARTHQVRKEDAAAYAKQHNMTYFEVSALENRNVQEAFAHMISGIHGASALWKNDNSDAIEDAPTEEKEQKETLFTKMMGSSVGSLLCATGRKKELDPEEKEEKAAADAEAEKEKDDEKPPQKCILM